MADEPLTVRGINWRETLPFTQLFRAFRIAVHPSKLALALVLLLLLYAGGRAMDGIWAMLGEDYLAYQNEILIYEHGGERALLGEALPRRGIFITFFNYEVQQVNQVVLGAVTLNWTGGLAGPGAAPGVLRSVYNFFVIGPGWLLSHHPVFFILLAAWFLVLWSVLGGAIARIAAVHVARDERMSVRSAVMFSVNKILSFLFAPLIPLVIVAGLGIIVAIGGLLLYLPWVGPIVVGLIYFLALLAGFIMAVVLIGTVGGLNLMFPTIAVEGSDSFDAISRSFSYVFARPWRMLWYTVVAVVYGALCYLFVRLFIFITLALSHFFTQWWLRDGSRADLEWQTIWPGPAFLELPHQVDFAALDGGASVGAFLTAFWVYLLIGLLGAFAISFYFSANTIIYYLLRREVDATELDDVYLEQTDEEFVETPVSPAAESTATTTATTTTVTETRVEQAAASPPAGQSPPAEDHPPGRLSERPFVTPPPAEPEPPPAEPKPPEEQKPSEGRPPEQRPPEA